MAVYKRKDASGMFVSYGERSKANPDNSSRTQIWTSQEVLDSVGIEMTPLSKLAHGRCLFLLHPFTVPYTLVYHLPFTHGSCNHCLIRFRSMQTSAFTTQSAIYFCNK